MDDLFGRLMSYAEREHLTQKELAKMLGVSANTITNWKNGGEISVDKRRSIEALVKDYVMPPGSNVCLPSGDHLQHFPVLSTAAAAMLNTAIYPIAEYAGSHAEEYQYFRHGRPGDFVLEVVGDSMLPWYPPGTRLLCRPNVRPTSGKRVVAVLGSGEVVFKIFVENHTQYWLMSINDDGVDLAFDKNDYNAVRAIYPVIESVRDEQALDSAMVKAGVRHRWQEKIQKINSNGGNGHADHL